MSAVPACYQRHEVAPGAHRDIPHLNTECVTPSKENTMSKTTAVVSVYTKESRGDGQTLLGFGADYADERNKEWAKYTPGLSVTMTVLDSVAEQFEQGGRYLLTFERAEA